MSQQFCLRSLWLAFAATCLLSCAGPGRASFDYSRGFGQRDDKDSEVEEDEGSVIAAILLYVPNRVFDVLDIVRARVRLGPGLGVGVRATELADVFIGGYTSVYVGLPGPRGKRSLNLPIGFDSNGGLELGPADLTAENLGGPHYGALEVGAGGQAAMLGLDVGFDLLEVFDFVGGIFFLDFMDDDL